MNRLKQTLEAILLPFPSPLRPATDSNIPIFDFTKWGWNYPVSGIQMMMIQQIKYFQKTIPHENVFKPKVESRCFLLTEEGGSLILIHDPCSNHRQLNYSWPMRSESSVVFVV